MNSQIHELINMKARKVELEVELGTSNIDIAHLSHEQIRHIEDDLINDINSAVLLEMVNQTIKVDEIVIQSRH